MEQIRKLQIEVQRIKNEKQEMQNRMTLRLFQYSQQTEQARSIVKQQEVVIQQLVQQLNKVLQGHQLYIARVRERMLKYWQLVHNFNDLKIQLNDKIGKINNLEEQHKRLSRQLNDQVQKRQRIRIEAQQSSKKLIQQCQNYQLKINELTAKLKNNNITEFQQKLIQEKKKSSKKTFKLFELKQKSEEYIQRLRGTLAAKDKIHNTEIIKDFLNSSNLYYNFQHFQVFCYYRQIKIPFTAGYYRGIINEINGGQVGLQQY